ncbi:immediate early gene-1 [Alphabaculovirus altersperidaniae]|uniref:Immediate early gene-1 n=1 Tax=Spodoptera eridania nucleopolyhedrovirus TaxID=2315721 RepID=A0ABX6TR88_9ABAC|nr:immediate early gene-1 [Spodoptera eridania nucleopolyhedrovirus]QNV47910.1 immediate early gene-1 [Spodoptera eridania nucleopolyhedrovirus]
MHTPNHRSQVCPTSYKTAGSTPIRESLGPFLNFPHSVPQTPEMFATHHHHHHHHVVGSDIDYTDNNYNSLINNAEMINQTFDAATEDIDLDLLFENQPAFVETTDKMVTTPIDVKSKIKKAYNSSSVLAASSSSKQRNMSPLKNKRLSKEKRSSKGLGAAMKRIRMSDTYKEDDDSSSSSSSDDDDDVVDMKNNNIAQSNNEPERIVIKPKSRGRYAKKMCVSSAMKPVHVEKPTPSDPATDNIFREIITNHAKPKVVDTNNRMFTSHMLETGYYMFIVSKPTNDDDDDETYTLRYINCVHSVHNEYTAHHMHNDRFVLVVTLERYRFMISYHLLLDMNIAIPTQDQFSEKQLADTNKNMCIFEEVKDFKFLSLLVNTFNLDQVYIQGKMSLLLASVGQDKARMIHDRLASMINTKVLFTLPLSVTKKEAPNVEELKKYDMSMYVEDIMKFTTGLKFKKLDQVSRKITRAQIVDATAQSLSFWYENKQVVKNKNNTHNVEKSNFTYKYGCIARQFYDVAQKGVKKLFKVKKENGSSKLIDNYLNACKERLDNHSFILVTTKADERITIIKMGSEFLWITSVIKDIVVSDIVKDYKMYNHYIYNLNNGNRKEINIRHNGMIKLLSNYTGGRLTLNETNTIAIEKFACNFESIIFDKKSAQNTE